MLHGWTELTHFVIMLGYLLMAREFVFRLNYGLHDRVAFAVFFVTCAGTHAAAIYAIHSYGPSSVLTAPPMVAWHTVEAAAVMLAYRALRRRMP